MTERGRLICQRVTRRIAEVAPPGLGLWAPAWEIVATPSDYFLDRLKEWESRDAAQTRTALEGAVNELVRAWRTAAEAWDAAGRPRSSTGSARPAVAAGAR